VANPLRFDGQYLNQATGFYKMGARYDVPAVSWWTQEDPMSGCARNPQSLNRYPFVENDLANSVDPTGNQIINPGFVACFET
jgi:RHS repeat-associated protein